VQVPKTETKQIPKMEVEGTHEQGQARHEATPSVHELYERLGFIVISATMSATKPKSEGGEWKKRFAFPRDWQHKQGKAYDKGASGFAVVTGAKSGATAIDIDDPETPHNKKLMALMGNCNLVAKTKKGFHYLYGYDARILQTAGDKLDTRNDGGCVFVAPSVAYDDEGNKVAEYEWIRVPGPGEGLVPVPEAVIDFLRALDRRYVAAAPTAPNLAPAVPTAPTASLAPKVLTVPTASLAPNWATEQNAPAVTLAPNAPNAARKPKANGPTVPAEAMTAEAIKARDKELMAQALRAAQVRAGTDRVGFPTRVVDLSERPEIFGTTAVRIEFSHKRGTVRVCPISRTEHESNHFFVTLGAEECTGLPALFMYCHSVKDCNAEKKHEMLAFVDPASFATIGMDAGAVGTDEVTAPLSIGQSAVLLGKMQAHVDRMMENPGGAWDTVESVGEVACALCTAASKHPAALALALELMKQLLGASQMSEEQKEHAARGFQYAQTALDPLMKVKGLAEGLAGKREQELMEIREAIVANTDAALEADVPKAAEHMLAVLDYCERLDKHGKVQSLSNFEDLGLFLYYVWRRVARFGFDKTQSSESHQWTFYLFNGATYERGQFEQLHIKAKEHMRMIIGTLATNVQLKSRVSSLEEKCKSTDFVSRSIAEMQLWFRHVERLARCGLVSPNDFQLKLDMGNYIGFKNGVYDILHDRFLPKGSVPLNVLVSMCTNYDYVGPDDAKFPQMRAEIEEFYRKLHADDYENPNDERLAAMWLLSGSLLFRGNVCKKAFVFLGSEGDNGKSTFTELIQLTLGDYAVTGNRSSLSGTQEQMTLDPDLVANHKSLVCTFPEVQSIEGGVSSGFKFNCGKLKALTGNDEQSVRGLYRDKKGIVIAFKPILHSNYMPQVDSDDSAARNRLWVARFGSTFPADLAEPDIQRRRFPRIENLRETMEQWAPYHFLLMLEALRDFRRRNCVLPVGAQQIEGSLMHQEVVAQTPEGRLRAWVESNYTHIPLREKDTGTKLEALFGAYTTATPPVHVKQLGKILFGKMLNAVYAGIGPHKNSTGSAQVYLLR
jgi:hypothetical protein